MLSKYLPHLLVAAAVVAAAWAGGNGALAQAGDGVDPSEWWKVVLPALLSAGSLSGAAVKSSKNHQAALASEPPVASNVTDLDREYLARIAASAVRRGANVDVVMQKITALSQAMPEPQGVKG